MTSASRDAVWERIMAAQEEYNRLERGFAGLPADRINWWLRCGLEKSLHAMMEVRGAHSHGGLTSEAERRLPKLERAAKAYSLRLAQLQKTVGEKD
jgi:hypothetical protein